MELIVAPLPSASSQAANRLPIYLPLLSRIPVQIHQIMDSNNSNAEQAKAVKSEGSTLITLKDGTSLHNSDRNSLYLSVIIEISNSQTKKNFAYLADQYIVETSGCVEIVIGIKLGNRRLLKAEVSLWRPQIVGESGQ